MRYSIKYLHLISNEIIRENQTIIIEDLNVSGMLKNHKLARSIQEISLHRFTSMLEYKAKWFEKNVIKIDRFFPSSKLCNNCDTNHDRDYNAAMNILMEGMRLLGLSSPELTLGEISSLERSLNQEKNVISCFA